MLEKLRSLFASAPKTLPQAAETITEAKATLDSVAALFTAAGLNLEQMLAAGPDSLKAHLASLDNSDELAEALQENERITNEHAQDCVTIDQLKASAATHAELFSVIGISDMAATSPTEAKAKFDEHVKKAANLELGQRGHPPAHIPKQEAIDDITPTKTDEDRAAAAALVEYEKLIVADNTAKTKASAQARTDFYAKNHALIGRGITLRRRG